MSAAKAAALETDQIKICINLCFNTGFLYLNEGTSNSRAGESNPFSVFCEAETGALN